MKDDRITRIQGRAYAIWEDEGRPDGRHEDHWRQAEQETGDEEPEGGPAQMGGDAAADQTTRAPAAAASRQRRAPGGEATPEQSGSDAA